MQMIPTSRAGAVKTATPLMILCFLAMGGFLYWLSTYRPTEVQMDAPVASEDGVNEVAFADFAMAPEDYMGEEFTMRQVEPGSMIGTRFFWTMRPDNQPYLVHISDQALADSVEVIPGRRVDLTGMVATLTDSLLGVWMEAGALRNEGDLAQAQYALDEGNYLHVIRFVTDDQGESGGAGPDDPAGSGDPSN